MGIFLGITFLLVVGADVVLAIYDKKKKKVRKEDSKDVGTA